MKTKTLLFSLLGVFSLSLMLTSCSMSVQKRRYNKGFYVDVNNRHHATDAVAENTAPSETNTVAAITESKTTTALEVKTENQQVLGSAASVPVAASSKKAVAKQTASSFTETASAPVLSRKEMKAAVQQARHQEKHPASGNVVLEVLLAILIPPLGVWLHEGEINSRFWIDLLLCFLFFLPGMIFALLVVLDAI